MKSHLKRTTAPRTWPIPRKGTVFVKRPDPSGHPLRFGMPMSIFLREAVGLATSMREVRLILSSKEILVNGLRVRRPDAVVGLMDVVTIPERKTSYRVTINNRERLIAIPIAGKETTLIPSKIISKQVLSGGVIQMGFHNGQTRRVQDAKRAVGGTLLLTTEKKEDEYFPLEKGAAVLIIAGRHVGRVGVVDSIEKGVTISIDKESVRTTKPNLFVVGNGKPAVKVA